MSPEEEEALGRGELGEEVPAAPEPSTMSSSARLRCLTGSRSGLSINTVETPRASAISTPRYMRSKSGVTMNPLAHTPRHIRSKSGVGINPLATPRAASVQAPRHIRSKSGISINPLALATPRAISKQTTQHMRSKSSANINPLATPRASVHAPGGSYEGLAWHSKPPAKTPETPSRAKTPRHVRSKSFAARNSRSLSLGGARSVRLSSRAAPEEKPTQASRLADALATMLSEGINLDMVNAQDKHGHSALHTAAWNGQLKMAQVLLEYDADLGSTDKLGRTPLHLAAWKGHAELVELLVFFKADLSVQDLAGDTPLHCAATWGHKESAGHLLGENGELWMLNKEGDTPSQAAKKNGHKSVIEILAAEEKRQRRPSFKLKKTLQKKASRVWGACTTRPKVLGTKSSVEEKKPVQKPKGKMERQLDEEEQAAAEEETETTYSSTLKYDDSWDDADSPSIFGDREVPDW
ncbi:unnamed protein product [Chrysoparadoxa australica]